MLTVRLINLKEEITDVSEEPISQNGELGNTYKGVYLQSKHKRTIRQDCVIKKLRIKSRSNDDKSTFVKEITKQKSLKHPSLLKILGFNFPFIRELEDYVIVTPYMKNGSLHHILQQEQKGEAPNEWTATTRAINVLGITAGLFYIYQNDMMHLNLKTENILLDENFYPKICDFGYSMTLKYRIENIANITSVFLPPEFLRDEEFGDKSDVYSYAMILYEIFELKTAFEELKMSRLLLDVFNGKRPEIDNDEKFPVFFKNLIKKCWANDPDSRPSFNEIFNSMIYAYKNEEIFNDDDVDREIIDEYLVDVIEPLNINDGSK